MLTTHNLSFSYTSTSHFSFPDLHCKQGEHWLILGPSGSGKTTFLHLLAGFMPPQEGEVHLDRTNLSALTGAKLDAFRGKHIGVVFQRPYFIRSLNVEQNLVLAQSLAKNKIDKSKIADLLKKLNIGDKLKQKPYLLSLGEQQRLSIARAIISQPKLILADEPTSSLDDKHCQEAADLLEESARQHDAILMIVTHDQRLRKRFPNQVAL